MVEEGRVSPETAEPRLLHNKDDLGGGSRRQRPGSSETEWPVLDQKIDVEVHEDEMSMRLEMGTNYRIDVRCG